MYNNFRNKKGITLVILIITILIMLILAGVAISAVKGDNGILKKSKVVIDKQNYRDIYEKVQTAVTEAFGTTGELNTKFLESNLKKIKGFNEIEGISNGAVSSWPIKVIVDNYTFEIDEEGELSEGTIYLDKDLILYSDLGQPIVVKNGSNVNIDLNGKKVNTTKDAIVVEEGANLTITGSGKIESSNGAIVNLGGTVVVESGEFKSSSWYAIKNLGNMTINGGTIEQADNNPNESSLIANGWYYGNSTKPKNVDRNILPPDISTKEAKAILTINGGTFIHYLETSTIKSDDWSKTIINNGEFIGNNGIFVQATGEVIINGGSCIGYRDLGSFFADGSLGYEPGIMTITNGKFEAKSLIIPGTNNIGTLNITGGTFNNINEIKDTRRSKYSYINNVNGGTYNIDVKNELPDGYTTKADGSNFVVVKQ